MYRATYLKKKFLFLKSLRGTKFSGSSSVVSETSLVI